jgi:hypothetical protein
LSKASYLYDVWDSLPRESPNSLRKSSSYSKAMAFFSEANQCARREMADNMSRAETAQSHSKH